MIDKAFIYLMSLTFMKSPWVIEDYCYPREDYPGTGLYFAFYIIKIKAISTGKTRNQMANLAFRHCLDHGLPKSSLHIFQNS